MAEINLKTSTDKLNEMVSKTTSLIDQLEKQQPGHIQGTAANVIGSIQQMVALVKWRLDNQTIHKHV